MGELLQPFPVSAMLGDTARRRRYLHDHHPPGLVPLTRESLNELGMDTHAFLVESEQDTYLKDCFAMLRTALTLEISSGLIAGVKRDRLLLSREVTEDAIKETVVRTVEAAAKLRSELDNFQDADNTKIKQRFPIFYAIFQDLQQEGIFAAYEGITPKDVITAVKDRMRDGENTFNVNTGKFLILLMNIYNRDRQKFDGGKLSWRIMQQLALNSKAILLQRAHGNTIDHYMIGSLSAMSDPTRFYLAREDKGWVVKQMSDVTQEIAEYRTAVFHVRRGVTDRSGYRGETSARVATTGCPASHLVPRHFAKQLGIDETYSHSLNEALLRLTVGLSPLPTRFENLMNSLREGINAHRRLIANKR